MTRFKSKIRLTVTLPAAIVIGVGGALYAAGALLQLVDALAGGRCG